jgi:carbonic anhydrase
MVPPYQSDSSDSSTTAGIEYAVKVLQVQNIVICGHSNCGGCKAMYSETTAEDAPFTDEWLKTCEGVKSRVDTDTVQPYEQRFAHRVEQENIILQMEHLRSYPFIRAAQEQSALQIYGWYHDIGKGSMYNYNRSSESFELIK